MTLAKTKEKVEFGDFQTPLDLASEVVSILEIDKYETIIEPTCGLGRFLYACETKRKNHTNIIGWEINPDYVKKANTELRNITGRDDAFVIQQDFFDIDWINVKKQLQQPILFIGNPPWVTNSELGRLLSKNLPKKNNFKDLKGLDAMTGKSNFDISEWMLIKIAKFISKNNSSMAFLVKTSVARKIFTYICKNKLSVGNFFIKEIDAKKYFNVNVDACLFFAQGVIDNKICKIFSSLHSEKPYKEMGLSNDKLISNINSYKALMDIDSKCEFKWRSGVKHDCSKVMEFVKKGDMFVNGFNKTYSLPSDFIYPMYKSSNVSKSTLPLPIKYMMITQKRIGEETKFIKTISPLTWEYLEEYAEKLDVRKNSIYKNSPRFSMFGVGDYTFKPWKVAISGLYKNIMFSLVGSYIGKPVVLDDTCYMLGFDKKNQAIFVHKILTSDIAKKFIDSLVFKDNKRPITVALLSRINIESIAKKMRLHDEYKKLFADHKPKQLSLFNEEYNQ